MNYNDSFENRLNDIDTNFFNPRTGEEQANKKTNEEQPNKSWIIPDFFNPQSNTLQLSKKSSNQNESNVNLDFIGQQNSESVSFQKKESDMNDSGIKTRKTNSNIGSKQSQIGNIPFDQQQIIQPPKANKSKFYGQFMELQQCDSNEQKLPTIEQKKNQHTKSCDEHKINQLDQQFKTKRRKWINKKKISQGTNFQIHLSQLPEGNINFNVESQNFAPASSKNSQEEQKYQKIDLNCSESLEKVNSNKKSDIKPDQKFYESASLGNKEQNNNSVEIEYYASKSTDGRFSS